MASRKGFPWWGWIILIAVLGGGGVIVYGKTRGLRNNNPGNIRKTGTTWQGMAPEQTDSAFLQFTAPEWGIRALARTLKTYYNSHGKRTVREIINRWAPPTENDTGSYVNAVASSLDVDPDAQLNLSVHLDPLVRAIIRHENGVQPYPDDLISKGIALA